VVLTDQQIEIRTRYYARVRTLETGSSETSHWLHSSRFLIRGKQLFNFIDEQLDLADTWVRLTWRAEETVTRLVVATPVGEIDEETGEQDMDVIQQITLTPEEIASGERSVEGLQPETSYIAFLYAGELQVGDMMFTTKATSNFTMEITPEDDLEQVIADAENNAIIGLHPGVYDVTEDIIRIEGKHITLASVSGNPTNTIINPRGFELRDDGSGIHLYDLTVDMLDVEGTYLIDLQGGATTFSSIHVQGCRIERIGRAFVRGSRAGNREHSIDY